MNTEQQTVAYRLSQSRFFLYSNLDTNVQLVIDAIYKNEVDPELIWRDDVVDDVISQCIEGFTDLGKAHELTANPEIRAALDEVYRRYPRFLYGPANDGLIIEAAAKHQINFDAQSLLDLVVLPEVWGSLALSQEFRDQQSAAKERERMINDLTKGGTSGFTILTPYGSRRNYDRNGYEITFSSSGGRSTKKNGGFENMSDDQIREIHTHVLEKRRLIGMAEQGTLAAHARNEGQKRLEERFHGDPSAYKSPMPTSETQAVVLVDPRNGNAITTRKQLIAYITSDRNALALLVRNKQGVTIPERALAVDRLLSTR